MQDSLCAGPGPGRLFGGNVVIDTGAGNAITVNGVVLADLNATDFIF